MFSADHVESVTDVFISERRNQKPHQMPASHLLAASKGGACHPQMPERQSP